MSCPSLKHRFEEEHRKGISFERAVEIHQDVEGSVAAHRAELQELKNQGGEKERIDHLQEHIREGEELLQEIRSMKLH
ncbi:MAG: hypothetical protein C4575_03155 [Desulforudis sp.]|jgi:hypothetical protein|nr:hypothetical protein [Clostridia bacterium]MDQ7792192.1 hypothetical protein [Clostridia bacterium]RJX21788.1 MAG: hypothetical protein C4575_03155 [Desulforudis sp.]